MASGAWGSWSHWMCSKEAERNECWYTACFLLSFSPGSHKMEWYFRVCLSISIQSRNSLLDIPRGVSMGILKPIRLTTKINHHKLKLSHSGKAFTKCLCRHESSRQTARYIPTLKISKRTGNQKARLCCLVTSVETKVIAGFCYCLTQETDGSWQNKPNILE